jgi:hypothetical protein
MCDPDKSLSANIPVSAVNGPNPRPPPALVLKVHWLFLRIITTTFF